MAAGLKPFTVKRVMTCTSQRIHIVKRPHQRCGGGPRGLRPLDHPIDPMEVNECGVGINRCHSAALIALQRNQRREVWFFDEVVIHCGTEGVVGESQWALSQVGVDGR